MALIETVNVSQVYEGKQILKNINLKIERAEVFTIIGPTGTGKTTLIRILDLLEPPSSGKFLFDGEDVYRSGADRLVIRRRMSYVQQKPLVFTMNVYDNIARGLRWRGVSSAEVKRRTIAALELVGMTGYRERNARTLSGGETQRVAIARALVTAPEVLFLDEPTANMDPISVAKIEQVLAHVIAEKKTTVVMTTHDMLQGQRLADRIGIIVNGELQQTGSSRDIFAAPSNRHIAEFVGTENIISGVITANDKGLVDIDIGGHLIEAISDYPVGEKVYALIRPEEVTLALSRQSSSARNAFSGKIARVISSGPVSSVEVDCGFPLVSLITVRSAEEMNLEKGKPVYATFKVTGIHVIKGDGPVVVTPN